MSAALAAKASRKRVRGFAPWKPQAKSLVLLKQVQAVLLIRPSSS
jgi:hypothetical protein